MTQADSMPLGAPVAGDAARPPARVALRGAYVTVEPLDPVKHGDQLWEGLGDAANGDLWRYLHSGPFVERVPFDAYLDAKAASGDPMYFALVDRVTGRAGGHAAYMRFEPCQRVIEVGAVVYTVALRKTRAATEAMYLMARYVFEELGYRRYEWKCNVLNDASQRAALRLGFAFEGVIRQHMIVKGRSPDTAWFAMLDSDWPARKNEFERWLKAENFDNAGWQKSRLMHV
jgi:RimJ/RimL family protein N-acetyltransferase